ncbi:MAG TPA: hypothetical protein VIA18_31065 [Polyangia bacterium]|jgi:hypothetical protein|nr:hypothetical protein [Polyangia bacterium]
MADVAAAIEQLLEEMVVMQRQRVLEHARRINSRLTDDDVQQPQDFPELSGSPEWNYEDGLLAGYQAAQAAVRAQLRKLSGI